MISGPIGHWLFASFAIVYARFFERGSRTVIIRFHPPIQEDGNVPTNARPTRTLRDDVSNASNPRNPLCHEAPFARTRNPLCTASEETRVHSTLSFHSHSLAPLDEPFFPRSVSAQSLFISLSLCYPSIDTKFVKEE